ncbi:hypothetical protein SASPL_120551 [Salvia splendens]|uniref:Uncharacterized protein n=1 Tax=Salvia splendens TaxID=180675 RepID=A0A8X8ZVD7_SALSN|nr:hypothetical protein SASPL_120551 [Salvia splendens]
MPPRSISGDVLQTLPTASLISGERLHLQLLYSTALQLQMESEASHSHQLPPTSEPSKQQITSTNDDGTSRKRLAEDSSEKLPLAPTKRDEVSFRAFEGKGFVALVHELEPRFRIPDRKKRYFDENDDKGKQRMGPPLKEDWDNAKAFVHFLKNFYDVTLELSASKTPTSQMIYVSMFALQIEIEKNVMIRIRLCQRNKLKMLQLSVKKLKRFGDSNQEVRELCDRFKNDLVILWAEYKGVSDTLVTHKPLLENSGDGDDIGLGGSGLFDELYNGVQEEVSQDQLNQISNEVDKYLADEMEKRLILLDNFDKMKGLVFKNQDQDSY